MSEPVPAFPDVMSWIHRALSAEAEKVQRLVEDYEPSDSLQGFQSAFGYWASLLMYHADVEDQYMTAPMKDFEPARVNEAEHRDLGALGDELTAYLDSRSDADLDDRIKSALVALHEDQHAELTQRLEDVLECLNEEIAQTRVIPRTKRHLYGKVVALRICQDDHLESEEAFVVPDFCERFPETTQMSVARQLLFDDGSDDPGWIADRVRQELTPIEAQAMERLEALSTAT